MSHGQRFQGEPENVEILTDKEIEELKERAVRQRNFHAANLLRWDAYERSQPMAKRVQSPFVRCKDARRHAGRSKHPKTVRTRRLAQTR
jgi:hypothetical protein